LTATSTPITVFCGRFGSGKTEIALNYAVHLAGQDAAPLLIDLDIVTPYFRSRDRALEIARRGVTPVGPFAAGQHAGMPAISPRILGAIEQPARPVVIDLGGDEQGARALAQYSPAVSRRGCALHFVVNPYRPFMDTVAGIRTAVQEIEASSRLQVSALVSNPNLMSESTRELFVQGHQLVEQAARELGLPVAFAVVSEKRFVAWQPAALPCAGPAFARLALPSVDDRDLLVLVIHRFFLMLDSP
jgi:hypothetical protein